MNDDIKEGFLTSGETQRILHVTGNTLRTWSNEGKIEVIRAGGGGKTHRRFNVRKFLGLKSIVTIDTNKRKIIYARVSTRKQADNLTRQSELLREKYPTHELITDIGSGINFKRTGLNTILDYAITKNLEEVVVTHKDRLCRFGYSLFERLFEKLSNAKIVVLNNCNGSQNEELAEDILTIVTVFSAKVNGRKRYKKAQLIDDEGKDNTITEGE